MHTDAKDFLLSGLAILSLAVLTFLGVRFLVQPLSTVLGDWHWLVDAPMLLLVYGLLSSLLVRSMLTAFPLRPGEYSMRDTHFTYWKFYTVVHEFGRGALLPFTTGSPSQSILAHTQRVRVLERFRRRVQTVRHVRVHAAHAVERRPRTHPASDCFVIRKLLSLPPSCINAADREIVHCPLTGGGNPIRQRLRERFENGVDDALRRLNVSPGDRRGRISVYDCSRRCDHFDRLH